VVGEPRHLPAAVTAAREIPELRFVLDHLGNHGMRPGIDPGASQPWARRRHPVRRPGEHHGQALRHPRRSPAPPALPQGRSLGPPPSYYDFALHAFGPNRLMFGSDWPPCTLEASYARVCAIARALTSGLSRFERGRDLLGHRAPGLPAPLKPGLPRSLKPGLPRAEDHETSWAVMTPHRGR